MVCDVPSSIPVFVFRHHDLLASLPRARQEYGEPFVSLCPHSSRSCGCEAQRADRAGKQRNFFLELKGRLELDCFVVSRYFSAFTVPTRIQEETLCAFFATTVTLIYAWPCMHAPLAALSVAAG